MITKWLRTAILGCLAVILIQCSPTDAKDSSIPATNDTDKLEIQAVTASPSQSNVIDEAQMTPTVPPPADSGLQILIDMAKDDLAQRLSISVSQISLVEAKEVVWPDASLGCPQPGMRYKQVPEDGALIILQVDGINYDYHNGGSRGLFLCEMVYKDPNPPPKLDIFNLTPSSPDKNPSIPTTPDNPVTGEVPQKLLDEIKTFLASHLDISIKEIQVIRAEQVVWPDGSLGCPQPDVLYTQAPVDGYWVILQVDGVDYDYRVSDSGYFHLCVKGGGILMSPPDDTPPQK